MTSPYHQQLIAQLHASDAFGTIVETGCDAVAAALLSVGGASNTVFQSSVPYNEFCMHQRYGATNARAVSRETVARMVQHHVAEHQRIADEHHLFFVNKQGSEAAAAKRQLNLVFASSFQVGGGATSTTLTHGWIGISYKQTTRFVHLSVREPTLERSALIQLIAECAIELMHEMVLDVKVDGPPAPTPESRLRHSNVHVDCITNEAGVVQRELMLRVLTDKALGSHDSLLTFAPDGSAPRFEEVMRRGSVNGGGAIIFKGSFNPPTLEHQRIARETSAKHNNHGLPLVFMLSIATVDKGDIANLWQRVDWLGALGYTVVINRLGRFADTINTLRRCSPPGIPSSSLPRLVFPVGADTMARIEPALLEKAAAAESGITFHLFERTPTSSTDARTIMIALEQQQANALSGLLRLVSSITANQMLINMVKSIEEKKE